MRYADRHRLSYLGWEWSPSPNGCTSGHQLSLIRDWADRPTWYGLGLKQHLQVFSAPTLTSEAHSSGRLRIGIE